MGWRDKSVTDLTAVTYTPRRSSPESKVRRQAALVRARAALAEKRAQKSVVVNGPAVAATRAERLAEGMAGGKDFRNAALAAGYSPGVANQGLSIAMRYRPPIRDAINALPLQVQAVDALVGSVVANVKEPTDTRLRASDIAYKRLGAYIEKRIDVTIAANMEDLRDLLQSRLAGVLDPSQLTSGGEVEHAEPVGDLPAETDGG